MLPHALEVAHDIAVNTAPVSVAVTKRLMWGSFGLDPAQVDHAESELHKVVMGEADAREGVNAYLERRDAELVAHRQRVLAGRVAGPGGRGPVTDAPTTTTTEVLDGVDLTGRTVLITGATTGIGKETARALAAAGATVVVTARTDEKGETAVAELVDLVPGADISYEVLELGVAGERARLHRPLHGGPRPPRSADRQRGDHGGAVRPHRRRLRAAASAPTTSDTSCSSVGCCPLLEASAPARVVLLSSGGHAASDILWDDPNFEDARLLEDGGLRAVEDGQHPPRRRARPALRAARGARLLGAPGHGATDLGRHFTREDYAGAEGAGQGRPRPASSRRRSASTSARPRRCGRSWLPSWRPRAVPTWPTARWPRPVPTRSIPTPPERLWAISEELVGEEFPVSPTRR